MDIFGIRRSLSFILFSIFYSVRFLNKNNILRVLQQVTGTAFPSLTSHSILIQIFINTLESNCNLRLTNPNTTFPVLYSCTNVRWEEKRKRRRQYKKKGNIRRRKGVVVNKSYV